MLYRNSTTGEYPVTESQIIASLPHVCFGRVGTNPPSVFSDYGYDPVEQTNPPSASGYVAQEDGIHEVGGVWQTKWLLVEFSADEVAASQAARIDALWRSADRHISGYISGIAIGLLTIGMLQAKPKALAVTAWSSSVWDAYYTRKALVATTETDDLNFSSFGPMPYGVPELRAELGM